MAEHAVRRLVPGMLHALLFTSLAFLAAHLTAGFGIEAAALGVLFGIVAGNLAPAGALLGPGIAFVAKRILTVAVVLLGLRVTAAELGGIGMQAAIAVGIAIIGALALAMLLGRAFKVAAPLAALIGIGTAVCGVSAIAAARRAVAAEDEEVAYAVAAVTLLGSIGLVTFPAFQLAFHPFTDAGFGILAGSSLHAVPQAIGAAFAAGGITAGAVATVVKLTRVALLGPVVLVLGLMFQHGSEGKRAFRLPVEVWGFLLLFVIGSIVALPQGFRSVVIDVDRVLLVAALTALGLQTRFDALAKAGARPVVVATVAWLVVVGAVAALLRLA